MFDIRLSDTFDPSDALYDFDLPQVPDVGDTIEIDQGGDSTIYEVLARRFRVSFHNGSQLNPERPRVLLHVKLIEPKKKFGWTKEAVG